MVVLLQQPTAAQRRSAAKQRPLRFSASSGHYVPKQQHQQHQRNLPQPLGLSPMNAASAASPPPAAGLAISPVFSYEDDPAGAPLRPRDRDPKARRTLLPEPAATPDAVTADAVTVDAVVAALSTLADMGRGQTDADDDDWTQAQRRVALRQDAWHEQQAVECIQRCVRVRGARRCATEVRAQRLEQQHEEERAAAAADERAEQERLAAEGIELARLQEEAKLAEASRAVEQRRVEALQSRVENQRQRRKQRLELNRTAASAAREALPPDASAKEVADLAAHLLPEIERSVLDITCCSRAETAPSGDRAAAPSAFAEPDWAEFAGLFASAGPGATSSAPADLERSSRKPPKGASLTASQAEKPRYHVAPPRPYDDWLRGTSGGAWRQQMGAHTRSQAQSAPLLGKLGKLVLPPVAVETAVAGHSKASAAWAFKGGAQPTASIRVLSAKRRISAGMRELQSELLRADRASELKCELNKLAVIASTMGPN